MPTISLCMIAKNEQQNIERCIKSAKPYVDQIVVVDTGSTDFTVEIAKKLGAEVYHHLWQDDFALARNKSLEKATGDWILFLDCDEELDQTTAPELRKIIQEEKYSGYWVKIINMFNHQPGTSFQGFRLFRNHPLHRFECPIHEQILPAVIRNSSQEAIGHSNITIYHHGYENDDAVYQSKIQRNLKILHKAKKTYGNAGFILFYIAVEHQKMGEYQKALEYYQQSLAKTNSQESYAPAMIRSMVHCHTVLGQYQQGLDLADRFLKIYPQYTDLVYLKGIIYQKIGKISDALACMNKCLAMGPPPIHLFSVEGIAQELPLNAIQSILEESLQIIPELVKLGQTSQAFTTVNQIFEQLKKTPFEATYNKLIQTMNIHFTGAQK